MDNICRFVPGGAAPDVIQTLYFVYETEQRGKQCQRLDSAFKLAIVDSGNAALCSRGLCRELHPGDLFFVFPAVPYTLEGDGDFCYYYISFLGARANMLLDRLGIQEKNSVFSGFEALLPLWKDALLSADTMTELAAESVLLYTLLKLGNLLTLEEKRGNIEGTAENLRLIKKYLDDHFMDQNLSLAQVAGMFSYSGKYISAAFKQQYKVGIWEYLITLRINHACALMQQGYTCVKDIAALCGYGDPLYFSKVFQKRMQRSPREYIRSLHKEKQGT